MPAGNHDLDEVTAAEIAFLFAVLTVFALIPGLAYGSGGFALLGLATAVVSIIFAVQSWRNHRRFR